MRIGIVCYPTIGGSGVVATELGKALADKGHQVHFITYDQPVRLSELGKNIFYHEVMVSQYPLFQYTPYELVLTSKLVDVVKHEKLDLLHVHYAIPHASAAYMAQQILKQQGINIPFITTLHGTDITLVGKDPSFEPVITFSINNSNAVTAVSESLKGDTLKNFDVEPEIQVIPNFICPEWHQVIDNSELKETYAPNGERVIMHMSNFRPVKRVHDVLKTFALIREKIPAKMILVGDGPDRFSAEKMCRELGTCQDTFFLGKVKDVEEVIDIADLFVLPSQTESFGLAALEAMISRVPVIATNAGGLPEVMEQGVSGFMSEVGDVNDMAKNALKILKDDESLEQFRAGAFKQANKFDIKNILPHYENLYNNVLSQ
ncbi:MAG: N-acetyl-alpha-D-glucosaminyl L-malate synthase BshA [Crocinitomicaceae bacterium]|nr:N-acetyl-alpha-D-glucosaminyl L-malate synthase BshA [Crocinitomicaceae bacterium]|tara:strand:- start:102560 stop:103684 length:1125 start_codon:yes stop_codon:yes gene_type:complete